MSKKTKKVCIPLTWDLEKCHEDIQTHLRVFKEFGLEPTAKNYETIMIMYGNDPEIIEIPHWLLYPEKYNNIGQHLG